MTMLLSIPTELLFCIADYLPDREVGALIRANRQLYSTLILYLYRRKGQLYRLVHRAAYCGNVDALLELLDLGVNLDSSDDTGQTALHVACMYGWLTIAQLLIEKGGANVDAQTVSGITPLYLASQGGHELTAQTLLEHGADISKQNMDSNRSSVLHIASLHGHTCIVRLLLEAGMDVDVRDRYYRTPLHYALRRKVDRYFERERGNVEAVLIEHGANTSAFYSSADAYRAEIRSGGNSTLSQWDQMGI